MNTSDMRTMTGAEMVVQALVDQGVDTIFGYPGGAVLPIYDALFKQNALRHILVRHEQAAVHAAEGYARSTGKVGCVLVTSGPGATNAVTGLTDALMDSIPIFCITGQVPTHMIGNDAFQEADTTGITRPCTKHNYLVKDINKLAETLHEAYHIARSGRPGPGADRSAERYPVRHRPLFAAEKGFQLSQLRAADDAGCPRDRSRCRSDRTGGAPDFLYRRRCDQCRAECIDSCLRSWCAKPAFPAPAR